MKLWRAAVLHRHQAPQVQQRLPGLPRLPCPGFRLRLHRRLCKLDPRLRQEHMCVLSLLLGSDLVLVRRVHPLRLLPPLAPPIRLQRLARTCSPKRPVRLLALRLPLALRLLLDPPLPLRHGGGQRLGHDRHLPVWA